jgi:hypothetical protein
MAFTTQLHIRLTRPQLKAWKRKAAEANRPLASLIRGLMFTLYGV